MKLRIKQTSWSGWSKDRKSEEFVKEYDINLNEKYVIKTLTTSYKKDDELVEEEKEVFSFDVIEIKQNSIKIHTYQPFSDNQDGTVNLNSDKKEFIISEEKSLKLITPTMDYGEIFVITLVK